VIKPKEDYVAPEKEFNLLELKKQELKQMLALSEKESVIKSIAIELGLGGVYSEEACIIAKIDKSKKPKEISDEECMRLFNALKELAGKKIAARTVNKDEDVIDITPFELQHYADFKQEPAESYSKALDIYFSKFETFSENAKYQKQIEKVSEIVREQKKHIAELEELESENKKKAELLYENYQRVSETLSQLKEISKKHSWKEISEKLKGHKLIKEVIPSEKAVVVEL
jgi:predicted ribosome quality control (RQC) complex YloA/Tae2 family protein